MHDRNDLLQQLDDLRNKLGDLRGKQNAWIHYSTQTYQLKNKTHVLEKFNKGTIAWIAEWVSEFDHLLTSPQTAISIPSVCYRKKIELQAFIALRKKSLPGEILDIPRAPFMPAHVACLAALEMVRTDNESLCQLSMPWVTRVLGSADEYDIKKATDSIDGKFCPADFYLGADSNTLIDVLGYLDYAYSNANIASSLFSRENGSLIATIKKLFGTSGINYVRALEYFHYLRNTNSSKFGYHVLMLATELHESSIRRTGDELLAAPMHERIISFRAVWNSLDIIEKEKIATLHLPTDFNYPKTFEDYLLCVFVTAPADQVNLTQEEVLREKNNNLMRCSAILSSIFFSFLERHTEWFFLSVIKQDEKPIYTHDQLIEFKKNFERTFETYNQYYRCDEFLSECIQDERCDQYEFFFQFAPLLFSLPEDEIEKIVNNDWAICFDVDDVCNYLSCISDKKMRFMYWKIFEYGWKDYFTQIKDIISLCSLFDEKDIPKLSRDVLNIIFNSIKKEYAFLENVDLKTKQSFLLMMVKLFPDVISNTNLFFKNISIFKTEKDMQHFINTLGEKQKNKLFIDVDQPRNKGHALLEFLKMTSWKTKRYSLAEINAIRRIVLKNTLSKVLSEVRANEALDSSFFCCLSLFYGKKNDSKLHGQLSDLTSEVFAGKITVFKADCEKVKLLRDAMLSNDNGYCINTIKSRYSPPFFPEMYAMLQQLNYYCVQPSFLAQRNAA